MAQMMAREPQLGAACLKDAYRTARRDADEGRLGLHACGRRI